MIWLGFLLLFLVFICREILFGLLVLIKQAKPLHQIDRSFDRLAAQSFKTPKVFSCRRIVGHAISWNSLFGDILFVEEDWWRSRSPEEKEAAFAWFSLANSQLLFFQRIFGLFSSQRLDRDCLLLGCQTSGLLTLLESLQVDIRRSSTELLDSALVGLSLHAGILAYHTHEIESRIQALLDQQRRLQ